MNENGGRFTCKCKEGFGGTFCDRNKTGQLGIYSRSISSSFNSSSISRDPMTVIFHVPLMFYNCFTSPVILHAISIHCFELLSHLCSEQ